MTFESVPAGATGVITIDLGALKANWASLAKLVAPTECAAVVKADAYGLGADKAIPALMQAGCRTFFVATPDEAWQARLLAPSAAVYVLDGLLPGAEKILADIGARPVLSTLADVRTWSALALAREKRLQAALHVDTGLNRLGLHETDIQTLIEDAETASGVDFTLIMSHLACADDPHHPKNEEQRTAFDARRGLFPTTPASLAASDGLMLGKPYHYDIVRPGYALYGGQAFQGGPTPVEPVVSLRVRILQVQEVAAGQTVGYSATWQTFRPSRIATIAAGYADGLPRHLSAGSTDNGGRVRINGRVFPIVGRVSMDLATIDITDANEPVDRGDWAELIGPDLPIETMGRDAGTIGYEILTRLGRRFHRIYTAGASR